jgi:hypothetical protein
VALGSFPSAVEAATHDKNNPNGKQNESILRKRNQTPYGGKINSYHSN